MIRGKQGFWLLTVIFSLIAMLVVLNGENYGVSIMKDMDGTMGQMIKKEHASYSSLSDVLLATNDHDGMNMGGASSLPAYLKSIDLVGFSTILILLPLLVGASALMVILWL